MTGEPSVGMEELERRLRGGDAQALAELFSRERERLWRIVQFRLAEPLRGRLEPDDVLQEAFLAASQRLKHYADSPATSPFIWVRMILNQTLVDLHRQHLGAQRRDAAREVSLDATPYPQPTSASVAIQLVGAFTSPSGAAARADLLSMVQSAIGQMDPIDREVLALRHFEELTNREVAETLGIEQKAASIRLFCRRGRRQRRWSFPLLQEETWDVGLNSSVTYQIDLNVGVGQSRLDLTKLLISGGTLDGGVGTSELYLPGKGNYRQTINGGVGTIRIYVPSGVAVRAEVNGGLGSFNRLPGMQEVRQNVYETPGFSTAENAVTLIIDGGVGSISMYESE